MDIEIEATLDVDNVEEIKKATSEAIINALDAIGMQAATLARMELQNSPSRIDTGLLRNSITHAVSGKPAAITEYKGSDTHTDESPSAVRRGIVGKPAPEPRSGTYEGTAPDDPEGQKAVYIGTNVEYAPYVHEGTDRMAPNRFLKNAIEKNKSEFEQIFEQLLHNSVG